MYQNKNVKKRVVGVQNKMKNYKINNQLQNKHQMTIIMMMMMILLIIIVVDIENEIMIVIIIDHQGNVMTIDIIVVDVQKSM